MDDEMPSDRHSSERWSVRGVTRHEYAELAGVHIDTIKRWARRGIGPQPHRIGPRLVRYDPEEVLAYLRTGERRESA